MTFSLPTNFNKLSTRELIINTLTQEWPLSVKQILERISRCKKTGISYQAVHKVIKQLIEETVIEHTGKGYKISEKWINEMKKFGNELGTVYSQNKICSYESIKEGESKSFTFNTFIGMARFIIDYCHDFPNPEKKAGACQVAHAWPVTGLSEHDYKKINELLAETQYYEIVKNTTALDKIFAKFLNKMGKKVKVGVDCASVCDLLVKGDYIAQIYFSKDLKQAFAESYKKIKSIDKLDMNELFKKISAKKTRISVILVKNAEVAERIREQTLQHFKGEK